MKAKFLNKEYINIYAVWVHCRTPDLALIGEGVGAGHLPIYKTGLNLHFGGFLPHKT